MMQWFFVILMADMVAAVAMMYVERVLFTKVKKKRARRVAKVIPIRKSE